ncbi:MAG: hypothetical protein ACLFUC_01170 [Bacteroidales bacterium]
MMQRLKHILQYYILILIAFFTTCFSAGAQQLSAKATLDTNILLIGDQTWYRLEIEKITGIDILLPVFSDTLVDGVEILETVPADTQVTADGLQKISARYRITSFDSGSYSIPPVALPFTSPDFSDTAYTSPVSMTVYTMPVDTTNQIFDIKSTMKAPLTISEILPVASLLLLGIIVVLLVVYFVLRIRRKKPVITRRVIEKPPHTDAFNKLEELKEEKLWQQGKTKEYYTRLTEIIRVYIEKRFGIKAMEQTSDEILHSFESVNLKDRQTLTLLEELLLLADMVKFAKAMPQPGENEKNIENAYNFVKNTMFSTDVEEKDKEVILTEKT